jgi:hypothetical protein
MTWCADNQVDFLFGLAGDTRLYDRIASLSAEVCDAATTTGKAARGFTSFDWITKDSWTRRRRVVAKAEWRHGNRYHRFIVTTLPQGTSEQRALYEQIYCARGDMENRIKECQMDLFSDRTSSHIIRANQLRLWFSAAAYVLLTALQKTSPWADLSGGSDLWHNPRTTAQNRDSRNAQRASDCPVHAGHVPLPARIRPRSCMIAKAPSGHLTKQTAHRPYSCHRHCLLRR